MSCTGHGPDWFFHCFAVAPTPHLSDNARPFMDTPNPSLSRRTLANAVRALSLNAVQAANSGHPAASMGLSHIAEVLWRDVLRHNPGNPCWANRYLFVLSNGHGSILLYSLLYLTCYPVAIHELK